MFMALGACLLALLLVLGVAPAYAQAVHRCTEHGQTVYTDRPCHDPGSASTIATDKPSAEDAKAARREAERQQALAGRLGREREREEMKEKSARARLEAGRAEHARKCRQLEMRARWAKEDAQHMDVRREARAKRKWERRTEQWQAECGGAAS